VVEIPKYRTPTPLVRVRNSAAGTLHTRRTAKKHPLARGGAGSAKSASPTEETALVGAPMNIRIALADGQMLELPINLQEDVRALKQSVKMHSGHHVGAQAMHRADSGEEVDNRCPLAAIVLPQAAIPPTPTLEEEPEIGCTGNDFDLMLMLKPWPPSAAIVELGAAMAARICAIQACDNIRRNDLREIKAFARPPDGVKLTFQALSVLFSVKPVVVITRSRHTAGTTASREGARSGRFRSVERNIKQEGPEKTLDYWGPAKEKLLKAWCMPMNTNTNTDTNSQTSQSQNQSRGNLFASIRHFSHFEIKGDKQQRELAFAQLEVLVQDDRFSPETVAKSSRACALLCAWVHAICGVYRACDILFEGDDSGLADLAELAEFAAKHPAEDAAEHAAEHAAEQTAKHAVEHAGEHAAA